MSVAKTYAAAFIEAAVEQKAGPAELMAFEKDLDGFLAILESSKEVRVALFGPMVPIREKIAVVQELSKKSGYSEYFIKALSLLVRKGRLPMLRQIRNAFAEARLGREGIIAAEIISAEALSQEYTDQIAGLFQKKLGKRVAFAVQVEPKLLAGLKVIVNGVTYDGSLKSQLQRLRDRLTTGVSGAQV